jgi:hypothetical protein
VARLVAEPRDARRRSQEQVALAARSAARAGSVDREVELGVGILRVERMPDDFDELGRHVIVPQTGKRKEFWMAPHIPPVTRLLGCHLRRADHRAFRAVFR